jgi:hypothetical protein
LKVSSCPISSAKQFADLTTGDSLYFRILPNQRDHIVYFFTPSYDLS